MSDETINIPVRTAGRGLPKFKWDRLQQVFAKLKRRRRLHVEELTDRNLADLGLSRNDFATMDPRPAGYLLPHGF